MAILTNVTIIATSSALLCFPQSSVDSEIVEIVWIYPAAVENILKYNLYFDTYDNTIIILFMFDLALTLTFRIGQAPSERFCMVQLCQIFGALVQRVTTKPLSDSTIMHLFKREHRLCHRCRHQCARLELYQ